VIIIFSTRKMGQWGAKVNRQTPLTLRPRFIR